MKILLNLYLNDFFLIIRFERYSFKNLWSIPKIRKMILKKIAIDQSCKVFLGKLSIRVNLEAIL
jgi:hypothetical protein